VLNSKKTEFKENGQPVAPAEAPRIMRLS